MSQPGRGTGRLTSIGPYTLLDRIGSGGMGVVYRALDRRSGTVVAFKLLHEHVAADPGAVERFRREAHVASLLRSSYVVRTVEFGQDDGRYYLVSDFIEGRTLAEILKDGAIEPLAAIAIVSQAALALDEAHSREITHRDIKPDNILVTEDGAVRLADFGIASMSYLGGLTRAGSYIGTVAYSAPEQHHGEADIRSDIYSLGVVLFEMLSGQRPFAAATETETMRLHEEVAPPLEILGQHPQALVSVIRRCLEKNPADRFQRPSELLAALDHARPAVAGAVGDNWMETAVAPLAATSVAAAAAPTAASSTPGETAVPLPAPAALAQTNVGPRAPQEPASAVGATRIGPPGPAPSAAGGGRSGVPRKVLVGAGAAAVALVVGVAAVFALMAGGGEGNDDDDDDDNGGRREASATATRTQRPQASPSPAQSRTPTPTSETPAPGKTATVPAGGATFAPVSSTPAVATSTPPPATSTPVPPTATATAVPQATFGSPSFATGKTQSGLPPAAAVPSGGTISGACPTEISAYVQHSNVPVGTQLTGSWQFQSQAQQNNPTFAASQSNGWTNYQFNNAGGLPSGTYTFRLNRGASQVTQGTVTVAC